MLHVGDQWTGGFIETMDVGRKIIVMAGSNGAGCDGDGWEATGRSIQSTSGRLIHC
jgi:hypothetical protein